MAKPITATAANDSILNLILIEFKKDIRGLITANKTSC
jgi:hypothetical protein